MWVRIAFVIAAVLVMAPTWDGPPKLPLFGAHGSLRLVSIPAPAVRTSGRLTWLGGAWIKSNDPVVGGFSALAVRGGRFTLLNDGGNFARFSLRSGQPHDVGVGALPDGPATGWEKRDRDSESLAIGADGTMWVGFERANAVWRYSRGFAHALAHARPPAMRRWSLNGGPEALIRLNDGRFVAFAESSRWRGQPGLAAVLFAGDPTLHPDRVARFRYLPAPDFEVSDAAVLPNGDIIVLERLWLLPLRFQSRLTLVKVAAIKPNALVRGTELGRIVAPWPTENYEGVAITRERGATILWLVSDNDQAWWRPSYLLKLRLD